MNGQEFFPSELERRDYKPLDKGMYSTVPSTTIPDGSFLSVKDMYVTPNGLQRRNGWRLFFQNKVGFARVPIETGEVIRDMESFFDKDNKLQMLAFSNRRVYRNTDGNAFETVPYGQVSYKITGVGANTITCAEVKATTAALSGSISGTTFTDTTHGSGAWAIGMELTGSGVTAGTKIVAFLTGNGTNNGGTYEVDISQTVTSQTISGIATDFTALGDVIRTNDEVEVSETVGSVKTHIAAVTVVNVQSRFTLQVDGSLTGVIAGQDIKIVRKFDFADGFGIDYTFAPGRLVMVDGTERGVLQYDGNVMSDMKVRGSAADISAGLGNYLKGASTVHYFNGYLILGNMIEEYLSAAENNKFDQKRTIRWSSISDMHEFAVIDYVIFSRETSAVEKITSSEECPFVFMTNAIYFGTPSELEGLPYQYARVESGAISAVGQRAMCAVPGGMVFIAQKNIYFMELARQGTRVPTMTPIGDPIYNKANFENNDPRSSRALFSPQQNILYCCFPKTKNKLGRLFCLSGETKAWSYIEDESSRFTTANIFPYFILLRWLDARTPTDTWTEYDAFTWFSLKLDDYTNRIFAVDSNGFLCVSDEFYDWDEGVDGDGTTKVRLPFNAIVESGDIDFGSPGHYKILTQMIVTLADVATRERYHDVTVKIDISTDRGKSWSEKADILIEKDTFIEDAHVRANGEVIRYRLTFGADAPLFTLAELQLRYRRVGSFVQRGP